ncbi:hypothetical protein ACOTH8_23500 [Achromobacter xylosoxidans]
MQSNLILTTAQAQAVYSAMCALNQVGVSSGDVVIPATETEHRINVYWNVEGVAVVFGWGDRQAYADQAAFAAAYGLRQPPDVKGLRDALIQTHQALMGYLPEHPMPEANAAIDAAVEALKKYIA